jgi:hypothetical protein
VPEASAVTGKEAIQAVRVMSGLRRQAATRSDDHTLALVASWPETHPEDWAAILDTLGLVDLSYLENDSRTSVANRKALVKQVWTERPWLATELAQHFGVKVETVEWWRRSWFRGERFQTTRVGKGVKAYQICSAVCVAIVTTCQG